MAKARQVVLRPEQEHKLIWARDHHQKAYVRELCGRPLHATSSSAWLAQTCQRRTGEPVD